MDTSTEGESHALVTYLGFYGAGCLFVFASIWLTIIIHGHKEAEATAAKTRLLRWGDLLKMRVPIEPDAHAESLRVAKRSARHIHAELNSIRKKVNDALTNGFWWNVATEGLQSREWQRGKDTLADEAPNVYDAVASVYVLADDMNAKAYNNAQGGHDEFGDHTAAELRSLRSKIKTCPTHPSELLRHWMTWGDSCRRPAAIRAFATALVAEQCHSPLEGSHRAAR